MYKKASMMQLLLPLLNNRFSNSTLEVLSTNYSTANTEPQSKYLGIPLQSTTEK